MANIVLDGDSSSSDGHIVTATGGVTIMGKEIAVTGDLVSNAKGHSGTVSGTHCSITINKGNKDGNDKVIIIEGDSVSCGDTMTSSSSVSVS